MRLTKSIRRRFAEADIVRRPESVLSSGCFIDYARSLMSNDCVGLSASEFLARESGSSVGEVINL